jgi:RNA polymerase sigma-70 factor (ECF subfamily)
MKSDEELMAAYVNGDQRAFAELFERYAPMLVRLMRRQIRVEDDALELVQQTFLQLHRARLDFEEGRKLRPWLMTIAFNLKREYFRRRKRRPEAPLEFEPPASTRTHPVERRADIERVRTALDSLPEGQREVIAMHWFEELSFPEVAQILGLTVSAVKVRAHRGYQALRTALEKLETVTPDDAQHNTHMKAGHER